MVKHISPNGDGSFTAFDSEDDGAGVTLLSSLFDSGVNLFTKRKVEEQKPIKNKTRECLVCHGIFKNEKVCWEHIQQYHQKELRAQSSKK